MSEGIIPQAFESTQAYLSAASTRTARKAAEAWTSAWSQSDPSVWLSVYSEQATYTDYAFFFRRRGHAGLHEHFNIWRSAHPDFRIETSEIWPPIKVSEGKLKCSIRTRNIGTFVHDLPTIKATGAPFNFYAVVDLVFDEESGLIDSVDEWYHKEFFREEVVERDF